MPSAEESPGGLSYFDGHGKCLEVWMRKVVPALGLSVMKEYLKMLQTCP